MMGEMYIHAESDGMNSCTDKGSSTKGSIEKVENVYTRHLITVIYIFWTVGRLGEEVSSIRDREAIKEFYTLL